MGRVWWPTSYFSALWNTFTIGSQWDSLCNGIATLLFLPWYHDANVAIILRWNYHGIFSPVGSQWSHFRNESLFWNGRHGIRSRTQSQWNHFCNKSQGSHLRKNIKMESVLEWNRNGILPTMDRNRICSSVVSQLNLLPLPWEDNWIFSKSHRNGLLSTVGSQCNSFSNGINGNAAINRLWHYEGNFLTMGSQWNLLDNEKLLCNGITMGSLFQ